MFESLNSSLIDICNEFNHRLFILLIFSIEIAVYLESPWNKPAEMSTGDWSYLHCWQEPVTWPLVGIK